MIVEKKVRSADVLVLFVEGLIKLGESAEFFESAAQNLAKDHRLVIDLAKVDYIDSTGIGELVGTLIKLKRSGVRLVLLHASERVLRLVRMGDPSLDMPVFEDEDEAAASVAA